MKEIEIVTIDFWNTLYDSSGAPERNKSRQLAIVNEIDKYELFLPADRINEAVEASWKNFEYFWKEHQITPSATQTVEFIWNYLKLPTDNDAIQNISNVFANGILIHKPKPINYVKEVLPFLKNKYKIALISDTGFSPGSVISELLKEDGLFGYFDSFSFSDETGVAKPHSKAFITVLEATNSQPNNGIHIGDIEHTDIKGAKNMGMKAIRFSGDLTKLTEKNPDKTAADFEVFDWKQIENLLL